MDFQTYVEHELAKLGLMTGEDRLDANETVHFTRELEHLKSQTYDVMYGPLEMMRFVPVDSSADPGAETITYRQYDSFGMAKILANYADDIPFIDVQAKEFTMKVVPLACGYIWTIQDVRRAAKAGRPILDRKQQATRLAVDQKADDIGAFGESSVGLTGFLNNGNVPITVLPHAGAWTGLTSSQIIDNLNAMTQAVITNTLTRIRPNTILLDTVSFGVISQKPVGVDNQTTILRSFLANNPYITDIDQWTKLDTAGAGNIRRAVCYQRTPMVLQWNYPVIFETFPPQAENFSFKVPAHSRVSGVEFHYPLGVTYADIAL